MRMKRPNRSRIAAQPKLWRIVALKPGQRHLSIKLAELFVKVAVAELAFLQLCGDWLHGSDGVKCVFPPPLWRGSCRRENLEDSHDVIY